MNLAFVVERPTQFEAPFYRFAAADPGHRLEVVFTGRDPGSPPFDPELGRAVDWGFDLLAAYAYRVCPPSGRYRWLRRSLASEARDLVIVNGYTQPAYLQAAFAARRAGFATALRLDSVAVAEPAVRRLARRVGMRLLARLFDLFLGTGSATREYLRALGVSEERTGLFPYAVDVETFARRSRLAVAEREALRGRHGIPRAARLVVCVTKLGPREAPWDLLAAWPTVESHERDDRWLLVAGDGPLRSDLERRAAERGLRRVRFAGYVPYAELAGLYGAADLFVHPVQEERWGVSVAEALACGLPVVASDRVGAARDLIDAGANGFVYAAGEAGALATAIDRALALESEGVRRRSRAILAQWDYAATWRGLLAAAGRARALRPA